MSTQLATIEDSVIAAIPRARELVKVHKAIDINAEEHYAIQQLYKNDFSQKTALANPFSVQSAVLNLASIGISLNPATKHAYLVPRDGMICLDISYMGLMHLAQQEGAILWGQAKIVYQNDTYTNMGADKAPEHNFSAFDDRGLKVGCYCVVKLPNGDYLTEEMNAEQVEQVRSTSKAKDSKYGPWNTFPDEMWRKTVVKRASKYWPKSAGNRFDNAVHTINQHEGLEEEVVTVDAIKKLAEYVSDKRSPLELFGYMEWFRSEKGDDAYIKLSKHFPPNQKTSGKEKLREGKRMYFDYQQILQGDDESAIEECMAELNEREVKLLTGEINLSIQEAA